MIWSLCRQYLGMEEDSPNCRDQGGDSNDLNTRYNKLSFANY